MLFEYTMLDWLMPEWKSWELSLQVDTLTALVEDSLETSHAMVSPIPDGSVIDSLFDGITYAKGVTVMHHLREAVEEKKEGAFLKAFHNYLSEWKYANAVRGDLWSALSETSGMDVEAVMKSWTEHRGYPVITLSVDAGGVEADQEWFFANEDQEGDGTVWWNLIKWQDSEGVTAVDKCKSANCQIANAKKLWPQKGDDRFVFVANGAAAFYRVKYPAPMLERLTDNLLAIPSQASMRIIDDALHLALAGRVAPKAAIELISAAEASPESGVIAAAMASLKTLGPLLSGTSCADRFDNFTQSWVATQVDKLGWVPSGNDSEHGLDYLRSSVLSAGAPFDSPQMRRAEELWNGDR